MSELIKSLKLDVITVAHSHLDSSWEDDVHMKPYSRFYYVNSGEAQLFLKNKTYQFKPGHLYLIPAYSQLSVKCESNIEIYWAHFNANIISNIDIFDFMPFFHELKTDGIEETTHLFNKLLSSYNDGLLKNYLMNSGLMLQLMAPMFVREQSEISKYQNKITRFQPVMEYINNNLDKKLSMQKLAEIAGFERTYFSVVFKQLFGLSPKQYIMQKRINKAQYKLQFTEDKLEVIAYELGFSDAFHLSKKFKEIVGMCPKAFKSIKNIKSP
ncbi:AraC family transcriptional regulator [Photobacterium sagamiensis]|uniref:AraC family transcriptional regulator n=1 Tax=Photobacterium sagamiensis TaxID=2910241 RepID=UPI003D11F513